MCPGVGKCRPQGPPASHHTLPPKAFGVQVTARLVPRPPLASFFHVVMACCTQLWTVPLKSGCSSLQMAW